MPYEEVKRLLALISGSSSLPLPYFAIIVIKDPATKQEQVVIRIPIDVFLAIVGDVIRLPHFAVIEEDPATKQVVIRMSADVWLAIVREATRRHLLS